MNRTIVPMLLAAATVLAGCETPSIKPLYSEDKRIMDAALVGRWKSEEGDTYTIRAERDHYFVVVEDHDKRNEHKWNLEVRLIQLGKHRFADIEAADKEQRALEERWGTFFIPTHQFGRYTVDVAAGSLKFWSLRGEWLSKQAVRPRYIPFEYDVFTSDTSELQTFLESHADDPDAFRLEELRRVKP